MVEGVHYAPGDVEAGTPAFRDGFLTLVDPELHDLVEVQEVRTMTTVSNLACTSIPTVRFERNPYAAQTCAAYGLLYATDSAQQDDRRRRMRDFFVQVATARHALVEEAQTYLAGLPDGIEWLVNVHSDRGKLRVDVSAGCRRSAAGLPRSVHVPTLEVRAAVLTDSRAQVVTERGERRVSLRGVSKRCMNPLLSKGGVCPTLVG